MAMSVDSSSSLWRIEGKPTHALLLTLAWRLTSEECEGKVRLDDLERVLTYIKS